MIERVTERDGWIGGQLGPLSMVVLSVVSLAIMLERAWLYWSLRDDAPALMRDLGRLLRERRSRWRASPPRVVAERRSRRRHRGHCRGKDGP